MKSKRFKVKTRLRKGDTVIVISGKDKNKVGEILEIEGDGAFVKGVNIIRKTLRKSKDNPKGGIIATEGYIHLSNLMIYDKKTKKGSRIGINFVKDRKVRFLKKSGEIIDKV